MTSNGSTIIQSGTEFFVYLVERGIDSRGLAVGAPVVKYLADMLTFYVDARNLHVPEFDETGRKNPQTLAEMWLLAQNSEASTQKDLLKKLGDRTLYISGFFSESLNRSLVDLDYYQTMGTSAYGTLAKSFDLTTGSVFAEISSRFIDFVEVFNVISQDSFVKTDQGILRLYETYLRTGSALAKEKLEALGVFTPPGTNIKKVTGH
jgi:hypothetical protein